MVILEGYPLVLSILKQFLNFVNRLRLLDGNDSNSIARHAFAEQKQLNLPWYTAVQALTQQLDPRKEYVEENKTKILPNALLCEKKWVDMVLRSMEKWMSTEQKTEVLLFIKRKLGF